MIHSQKIESKENDQNELCWLAERERISSPRRQFIHLCWLYFVHYASTKWSERVEPSSLHTPSLLSRLTAGASL